MKKLIAALLAVMIVLGFAATAFAAGYYPGGYYSANRPLQLEDGAEPYEPGAAPPANANNNPGTGR